MLLFAILTVITDTKEGSLGLCCCILGTIGHPYTKHAEGALVQTTHKALL